MITAVFDDFVDLAFDVRRQALQDRRGRLALHHPLPVDRAVVGGGREEKPVGNLLLPFAHDMERRDAAFGEALEHTALPLQRDHDEWRLEGNL